jgi:outer membrane usher protein
VELQLNDMRVVHQDVRFVATRDGSDARPCFTREMLNTLGVEVPTPAADADADADVAVAAGANRPPASQADECVDLNVALPGSTADFDFSGQKLALSVPQKYLRHVARGDVPPDMWQDGVNAGFISYNANTYRTAGSGLHTTQSYLGLNAGVNLGAWHLRHQSSVSSTSSISQGTGSGTHFDNIATYVQHDLTALKSQLTLGDGFTTGDVFDSVQFRGVQIATDDRMLPESLRGYAPVVRGTAQSNARVTVRQNAQVIYETSVSPGPFEISDLYATGYGGNLDVTVTEADGRKQTFTVPYAAVAQSLRSGTTRF